MTEEHTKSNKIVVTDPDEIDNLYIRDFKAKDLMVLATMLENEKVTPTDLNDYVRNVEHTYTVLWEDFNERCVKIISEMTSKGDF